MLASLLLNQPVPEAPGAVSSAGHHQERVIPGVTHYVPKKPKEIAPELKERVQKARRRLTQARGRDSEYKALHSKLNGLTRSLNALERLADVIGQTKTFDTALAKFEARYRDILGRIELVEAQIAERRRKINLDRQRADDDHIEDLINLLLWR